MRLPRQDSGSIDAFMWTIIAFLALGCLIDLIFEPSSYMRTAKVG